MKKHLGRLLLCLFPLGAWAQEWRLPKQVFPHEIAVLGNDVYVATTEGLWRLRAEDRIRRIGGKGAAAWPLAVEADRLFWLQGGEVRELNGDSGRSRPVPGWTKKHATVLAKRAGLFFTDNKQGTWWSPDGETWHGPIEAVQHAFTLDWLEGEWWAFSNSDPDEPDRFVLSRSRDLQAWTPAAEFTGNQPGSLAAGAGVVVLTEIAGVRVFDPREFPRSALVAIGPADERPAVYFEHGYFWLQGERDGLWRSSDGLGWQNLKEVLAPLEAPLVQVAFAPDALVLAGYTGKVIRVPLASLPEPVRSR